MLAFKLAPVGTGISSRDMFNGCFILDLVHNRHHRAWAPPKSSRLTEWCMYVQQAQAGELGMERESRFGLVLFFAWLIDKSLTRWSDSQVGWALSCMSWHWMAASRQPSTSHLSKVKNSGISFYLHVDERGWVGCKYTYRRKCCIILL